MMNSSAQLTDLCVPFFGSSSPATTAPEPGVAAASEATEKTAAALKNHSEAEKRRRERINGHLETLRTLIPGSSKMEKSTLLANAIKHLKELQNAATEATKGLIIPLDSDEIIVERVVHVSKGETVVCIKASVCCDYAHELLTDMKQSLDALQLKLLRVEMGMLRGRMKSVFFVSSYGENGIEDSVRRALRSVLDSFYASQELLASTNLFSTKRQRVSLLGSSSAVS